jgi:hypothetical protein
MNTQNGEIAIEHGVPIPPKREKLGVGRIVREMQVGDSFVATQRQRNAAFATAHTCGIKLTSRRLDDAEDQIRIWRIK